MNYKFIDLFCGCGGLSKGFTLAGYNCVGGIDFNQSAIDTFNHNFKKSKGLCCDLLEMSTERIIEEYGDLADVDVVIGGPPCQGFSSANRYKLEGADPRNKLFFEFVKFVDLAKPKAILIENVRGIVTRDNGYAKDRIYDIFENMGYKVNHEILDAADREEESLRREIQSLTSQSSSNSGTSAAVYSGGALSWPAPSTTYVTSPYGWRFHPIQKRNKLHTGIDIGAGYGASVIAAEGGTVLRAGWNGGYGQYIVIDHGNGLSTLYAHNSTLLVSAGQVVTRGQKIALVGSTGNSTGPHLHFEVLLYGQTQDPMSYFG